MARPPILLDPTVRETLLQYIRAGNHYSVAITAAGIAEGTFYQWKRIGTAHLAYLESDSYKQWQSDHADWSIAHGIDDNGVEDPEPTPPDPPYDRPMAEECARFMTEVQTAEGEAEVRLVALWSKSAVDDWRAARDFLARRFPDRWKESSKTEIVGNAGGPVQVAASVTVDRLDDVLAALIESGAFPSPDDETP